MAMNLRHGNLWEAADPSDPPLSVVAYLVTWGLKLAWGMLGVAVSMVYFLMGVAALFAEPGSLLTLLFVWGMFGIWLFMALQYLWRIVSFVELLAWSFKGAPRGARSTIALTAAYFSSSLLCGFLGAIAIYRGVAGFVRASGHLGDVSGWHDLAWVGEWTFGWVLVLFAARTVTSKLTRRERLQPVATRRSCANATPTVVAHLSDLHLVGNADGTTLEGVRGTNHAFARAIEKLTMMEGEIDVMLITGDITDSGGRDEWRAFFEHFRKLPPLLQHRTVILPGNHDINISGRSKLRSVEPANNRLRRTRMTRMLGAMMDVHGDRATCLGDGLQPVAALGNDAIKQGGGLLPVEAWNSCFPMVVMVTARNGDRVKVVLFDSTRRSSWILSNAFGTIPRDVLGRLKTMMSDDDWYQDRTLYALHHHVLWPDEALRGSERAKHLFMVLEDPDAFLSVLSHELEPTIFHGHRHVRVDRADDRIDARVIGAPSTTTGNCLEEVPEPGFYLVSIQAGSTPAHTWIGI